MVDLGLFIGVLVEDSLGRLVPLGFLKPILVILFQQIQLLDGVERAALVALGACQVVTGTHEPQVGRKLLRDDSHRYGTVPWRLGHAKTCDPLLVQLVADHVALVAVLAEPAERDQVLGRRHVAFVAADHAIADVSLDLSRRGSGLRVAL